MTDFAFDAQSFRTGVRDIIPLSLPAVPFGFVLGVAITEAGVGHLVGWAMSPLIFAGGSQLAAIELLAEGASAVVVLVAIAFINAQAFVWFDMEVPIDADYYGALFYAVTGTMTAVVVAGLVFTAIATFRALGGRLAETEVLSAHALFWYFAAAAYSAVWFVVYVTK